MHTIDELRANYLAYKVAQGDSNPRSFLEFCMRERFLDLMDQRHKLNAVIGAVGKMLDTKRVDNWDCFKELTLLTIALEELGGTMVPPAILGVVHEGLHRELATAPQQATDAPPPDVVRAVNNAQGIGLKPPPEVEKTIPYWPYCTTCKLPFAFELDEPFAYCACGCTEWGYPRPADYVKDPMPRPA